MLLRYDEGTTEHLRRGMRKAIDGFENTILAIATSILLLSAVGGAVLRPHLHLANPRVQYGVEHLPAALGAACLFTLLVAVARPLLLRWSGLAEKSTFSYLLFLSAIFCAFWLPVLFGGDFDQDDWMLLAAASIRKVIYLHPSFSWHALDSMDGNFRPLGTVLYFGYLFRWFGLSPLPYFAGLFAVNLLGTLVAFFLVRELGYSKIAAAAAALLFMSRSITYEVRAWPSALGDALVILLCGLMALFLLRALHRGGLEALGLHLLAWLCFFVATLAKQSAFAAPLIVALLLFLRPGPGIRVSLPRRTFTALLGLAIYSGTAAIAFFHAKSLSRGTPPYPIGFSSQAVLRLFSYATWYFGTFEFPSTNPHLWLLPSVAGVAVVLGVGGLLWRFPRMLGERPRDVLFCLLSAAASLSLFVVLANRSAPYYGSMAAFWGSIALGIILKRFSALHEGNRSARIAVFFFCLLLVTGFTDIRLEQTGLIPSGGYTWGTYTGSSDRAMYEAIQSQLVAAPLTETLVLADMPGYPSRFACMAFLASPKVASVFTYDSKTNTYYGNSLGGGRPKDGYDALNDPAAYNWTAPVDAARITGKSGLLWMKFRNGKIVTGD